ncbi:MAG TPA: HD domain-containing phosphohydrolase [Fimbriimonadaceae bacterium]|nr:HD domain-containing phosphohydrolase [Fimbriimonadaceae bacterium]
MKTILFVDDDESVLTATQRKLHRFRDDWRLVCARGGHEAMQILSRERIDAVVTDFAMPGMTGLELLEHIVKGDYGFIPVVVVTGILDKDAKRRAIEAGAQDLLSKPVDFEDLVARLRSVLALKSYHDELSERNAMLEDLVAARTEELASSRLELVVQLSKAADLRDHETGNHVIRVGMFSRTIAEAMGMRSEECDELFLASTLHDIGKIAISDSVLRKQGKLQPEERTRIEAHCMIGYEILSNRESVLGAMLPPGMRWGEQPRILKIAAEIAMCHHEWWNGAGYPRGLKGDEIPMTARIVALADVLDALRSQRPYKPSFSWVTATEKIAEARRTQFDPAVHDAFLSVETLLREFDAMARQEETQFEVEAA